jgi:putative Mg2+ transporter-C (MgtC) family protein
LTFRVITNEAIVIRILAAIIVGGFIGLERGMKNRPAGLRTYMLVCVGACLIMLTNQYIYQFTGSGDPMRLGAQVVSGIGFLGAGTIIVTKHNQIKGLTTAAGLWASAGVGLALGIGFYEAAFTASIGIYLILAILQHWEHRVHKKVRLLDVYIELLNTVPLNEFAQNLRALNLQIEGIQFEPDNAVEGNTRAIVFTLKSPKKEDHSKLLEKIKGLSGIAHLEEL